jgi:hypothetical protein
VTADQILKHVELTEFFKEVARQEASRILASADLEAFIDRPEEFIAELLAAILAALGDRSAEMVEEAREYAEVLGLRMLSEEEAEAIAEEENDAFLVAAIPALLLAAMPARDQVARMIEGAGAQSVAASLAQPATREAIFATFTSAVKTTAATHVQGLERAVIQVALELTDGEDSFEWVAVMDGGTCDETFDNSCAPRHGEVKTLPEWDEVGRPGAAHLICSIYAPGEGSYCRCQLSAVDVPNRLASPVDVADAIKAGKSRAQELYT